MAAQDWKLLRDKLELQRASFVPVTEAEVLEFEAATGFKLPRSYRDYSTMIGPGELVSPLSYQIRVPGASSQYYNLLKFNKELRENHINHLKKPGRFDHAWFFARDIGNGCYFWKTTEVTHPDDNEYSIYVLYDYDEIDKLSDTFSGFIEMCIRSAPPGYGAAQPGEENRLTFDPPYD